ncbi:MAG: hypothetical protein FI729_00725 [SAR202 cluster bacterium]|nr:hypothetical protein [SAR202 cluster bacterium]|tara:strand:+ start:1369 stop:3309 length:1941 start_codon:yes stop_codon:yes gene_type:complete
MKLYTEDQNVNVHGDFETSDFAIGDIAFIVDMFADKVYSHKERAIIRELSCNAHDSHVMAGTTDVPFNVHLPTQLEPFFSIRDFGTGLSDDEVRNIFAGIGISTKRDSNEVIGCFGIGSLSPYSMTDSFTVKSYIDGVCRTYTCYRDEERKPVVALLTELATDEANGLEVSLSVEGKWYEFSEEAQNVFRFWEGTVPQINDKSVMEAIEETREEYAFRGDDFGLTAGWGSMYALMGNIAYKIPDELDEFNTKGYLKFDLGELSFDTARENLAMDDKTKKAIKDKFQEVKDKLAVEAGQQIAELDTPFKQAVLANRLRQGNLGKHIKANLEQYDLPEPTKEFTYFQRSWSSTDKATSKRVPVGDNIQYYRHKDRMQTRIKEYLKGFRKLTMVILSDEQIKECLIDEDVLLDLEDLPKVVRQSYATAGSTVKTFVFDRNHSGWTNKDYFDETELTIDGDEIVYIEINRWEPQGANGVYYCNSDVRRVLSRLEKCGIDAPKVIALKSAFLKTKQFEKGNFIDLADYVKRELAARSPKTYYDYNVRQFGVFKQMHKHMQQQDISDMIELVESHSNSEVADWLSSLNQDREVADMEKDTMIQDMMDEFFVKYEMLTFLSDWEMTHTDEEYQTKIANYIGGTIRENAKTTEN